MAIAHRIERAENDGRTDRARARPRRPPPSVKTWLSVSPSLPPFFSVPSHHSPLSSSPPHHSALPDAVTLRRTRGHSGEDFKWTGPYKAIAARLRDLLFCNCAPPAKRNAINREVNLPKTNRHLVMILSIPVADQAILRTSRMSPSAKNFSL